jgi:ATP-dependent helicase/nuclease subunit A
MLEEVLKILRHPQFASIFGVGSQAEVPITATLMKDGVPRILSGQIDRLLVTDKKVLVLDYKTNRQVPVSVEEIPDYYRLQLGSYAEALALIYPDRVIETAILWTSKPLLMPLTKARILPT